MLKNKFFDAVLLVLVIAVGMFFFLLVQRNGRLGSAVRSQELQTRALIEEIGQTREENLALYRKLLASEQEINALARSLTRAQVPTLELNISSAEKIKRLDDAAQEAAMPVSASRANLPHAAAPLATRNFLIVGHNRLLADTIMLALVDETAKTATLVSVPRDLFVNGRKINEYLSRYGMDALKEKVESVTNVTIEKYIAFNFNAFETMIDLLGGIDIDVEKAIYDPLYPDGRGNYVLYQAKVGMQHMNGSEALKYARSRHSTSDFDRARRQQRIIESVLDRAMSFDFITNPNDLRKAYETLREAIITDLSLADVLYYVPLYRGLSARSGEVLSTANFLYPSASVSGQYILLPHGGSFKKIQEYIRGFVE